MLDLLVDIYSRNGNMITNMHTHLGQLLALY